MANSKDKNAQNLDWAAPNLANPTPNKSTGRATTIPSTDLDPKVQRELLRLDPGVQFKPKSNYLHHTWAQTFFSRPEYYFQPESISELQKIVTIARRCRKRLCVTGFGHSPSDLTCTSSWLINLDNLSKILEINLDNTPGLVRFQAGISLHNLNLQLAKHKFTLPNLGSIDVQSLAGSISTGTHGSSLKHGLLSQSITSLTVLLSNSQLVTCSANKNPELFRAALCSLGSLGIVVEMTFQAVPDFNISWSQSLHPLADVLSTWNTTLWSDKEFTRVWWLPYLKRAVVWTAEKSTDPVRPPNTTFYGGKLGYYIYHNLLALSNYIPRILPTVEWFIFGMQYGFKPGRFTMTAVQPAREGLLMDCLYSQLVNEWAIPLSKGPEAITRLSAWINHDDATAHIPVSSKDIWIHSPIEVRVSDTNTRSNLSGVHPYLDPTRHDGPTLYLNATLYRPYGRDPPCHERYYEAFEHLMRELGGRPHWAKNFSYTAGPYIKATYGDDMADFLRVRDDVDPDGMFLGDWHQRNLLAGRVDGRKLLEGRKERRKMGLGYGDGQLWVGQQQHVGDGRLEYQDGDEGIEKVGEHVLEGMRGREGEGTPSPPVTTTSEESFDYMAKGEASVYTEK